VALASAWLSVEARLVLLTRGAEGATMFGRSASVTRPARPVKVADTVGAGDSIMGGLLAALAERGWLDLSRLGALTASELAEVLDFALTVAAITVSRALTASELTEVLEFALAVAAITVSRIGADPPRRDEVSAAFGSPSR
jgi:fructokinase